MHVAAKSGRGVGALRVLLDADPSAHEISAKGGFRPIHDACQHGRTHATALLLELGADPSAVTSTGRTALHTAAGYGHTGCVQLLLDWSPQPGCGGAGAEVRRTCRGDSMPRLMTVVDGTGRTAEALAEQYNMLEAAALIRAASGGAKAAGGVRKDETLGAGARKRPKR